MINIKQQPNLQEKLLIFIGYCLPRIKYKFSYQKIQRIFQKFYQKEYSLNTLRKELSILKKQGLIEKSQRYRKPIPQITRSGRLKITPYLPHKKYGDWDKLWRLVIFKIPENERKYRTQLRQKLFELGFKKIQKGVYISPHPFFPTINRLSNELGIRQYLQLIEAEKIDRPKQAIQKIWDLYQINQEYQNFIKETQKTLRQAQGKQKFWPLSAKKLEQQFFQIYQEDPHLPEEFLPKNWQAGRAYQIYKKIATSY